MFGFFRRKARKKACEPVVYARADHCISRKNIDPDALKVLYRLNKLGYIAYLVGEGLKEFDEFEKYEIAKLDKQQAMRLQERYLISPALMKSPIQVCSSFMSAEVRWLL